MEDFEFRAAVGIPTLNDDGTPSDTWICVDYFSSYEEALAYAQEYFNADENGCICLVSYGTI